MASETLNKSQKIQTLDGLRGISIIAVIGFHGGWSYFDGGGLGVDLFFVISGFLITTLLIKEKETHGSIDIRKFYWRRALRIFPAYLVFLAGYYLVVSIVFVDFKPRVVESLIIAGLYSTNFMIGWFNRDVLVAHTWSLSLEEQFYLLYPALIMLFPKRVSLIFSMLLLIIALIWRCLLYLSIPVIENPYRFFYSPDTRLDTIVFGCVAAILLSDRKFEDKLKLVFGRADVFLLSILIIFVCFYLSNANDWFRYTFAFSVNAVCFTSIVLYAIGGDKNSICNRILSFSLLQKIGLLSYSLYLWHPVALGLAGRVAARVEAVFIPYANLTTYISVSLFFAVTSYFIIERPFLVYKKRFSVVQVKPKS
jgi:peptidoglycan/LPS O-acetylase OafA/YrhL